MQRRLFLRNTSLVLGALALSRGSSLAGLLADPAYKIKMLTETIGIFSEKGGTILFMLSGEGTVIVDAQFPETSAHLIEEIKKKTTQPFRLLINTHHHRDHTAGNIAYKDLVLHVLAHENSKRNQENNAIQQKTTGEQLYPDQVFKDTWCETAGKEKICLHHFGAGHTNGDSIVHFEKSGIVHMGDLVFNRRHPYVDTSAGARISNWISLLDTTASRFPGNTIYVCGHAGTGYDVVLKKEDVLAFRGYLQNVMTFTEAAIKTGMTKEEILKATMIPGSPDWQGDGIERPLSAAYEELTRG